MHTRAIPTRVSIVLLAAAILAFAAIFAVPALMTGRFSSQNDGYTNPETSEDLLRRAAEDRSRVRLQRRMYNQAIDRYQEYVKQGRKVRKPDFNDPAEVEAFLKGEGVEAYEQHLSADAAVGGAETVADENTWPAAERKLLRSYVRAGACPENLKESDIPGFYDLCRALVGEHVAAELPQGMLSDKVQLRRARLAEPKSMKARLRMVEEAHDRGNRRESGPGPGRPAPYGGGLESMVR